MAIERFEYRDETAFKYWEIQVVGARTLIRFGRVGTSGTNVTKKHANAQEAQAEADKLIREKQSKGYVAYSPDRVTPIRTSAEPASAKNAPNRKTPKKNPPKKKAPKKNPPNRKAPKKNPPKKKAPKKKA